jgi:hypothetical protein
MHSMLNAKKLLYGLSAAAIAAACVPAPAGRAVDRTAVEAKTAVPATLIESSARRRRAVDAVALAADLASYGYQNNSAISLLTAAELLIQASPTTLSGKEGQQAISVAPKSTRSLVFEPGALISSALSMGAGNQNVSAIARQLRARLASSPKGALGGPRTTTDRVLANTTDIWHINFSGGQLGSIRVDGDGDTDLDCYVYSDGRLVAVDDDYTDYCILDWYQRSTGPVRLEIRNLGRVYNQYVLTTN